MLVSFVANSPLLQYLIDALLRPLGGTPEGVVEAALAQGRGQALDRRACIGPSSCPLATLVHPREPIPPARQPDQLVLPPHLPATQAGAPRRLALHPDVDRVSPSGPTPSAPAGSADPSSAPGSDGAVSGCASTHSVAVFRMAAALVTPMPGTASSASSPARTMRAGEERPGSTSRS